jgi:hypothetical protein
MGVTRLHAASSLPTCHSRRHCLQSGMRKTDKPAEPSLPVSDGRATPGHRRHPWDVLRKLGCDATAWLAYIFLHPDDFPELQVPQAAFDGRRLREGVRWWCSWHPLRARLAALAVRRQLQHLETDEAGCLGCGHRDAGSPRQVTTQSSGGDRRNNGRGPFGGGSFVACGSAADEPREPEARHQPRRGPQPDDGPGRPERRHDPRWRRPSFREFVAEHAAEAAERAFARASLASGMAKVVKRGRATLRRVKVRAIKRARELSPSDVTIGIDCHYHVGLPSVEHLPSGRRLHVPWDELDQVESN